MTIQILMILCDRLKLHIDALNDHQVSQTSKRSPSTKSEKSRTFILAITLCSFSLLEYFT